MRVVGGVGTGSETLKAQENRIKLHQLANRIIYFSSFFPNFTGQTPLVSFTCNAVQVSVTQVISFLPTTAVTTTRLARIMASVL